MEPVHVKEALSLLHRLHLFGIQNEGDGSLQYAMEGIINKGEGIAIRSKKETQFFFFFISFSVFCNMFMMYSTGVQELKVFLF